MVDLVLDFPEFEIIAGDEIEFVQLVQILNCWFRVYDLVRKQFFIFEGFAIAEVFQQLHVHLKHILTYIKLLNSV